MSRYIILFLLLFTTLSVKSSNGDQLATSPEKLKKYVYATISNVRDVARMDGAIIDKLRAGHAVTLEEYSQNIDTIKGVAECWARISYAKNGELKSGYVWGGNLISIPASESTNHIENVKVLYGIDACWQDEEENTIYTVGIKIVKGDKLISESSIVTRLSSDLYLEVQKDGFGLTGVENIIELISYGESCGIPSYHHHFAWDGSTIIYLQSTISVGDGGMGYKGETLIYPKDGDLRNVVLKVLGEGESSDESFSDDYSYYETERFKVEAYKWNGKKLVLQSQN